MTELSKIELPDGSVKQMKAGATPYDVAAEIGPGLAKAALAARVDGEVRDLKRPFDGDARLELITKRDEADALELVRHDFAHVLAEAVQNLFPGTQITFGPATDDGFYYDFAPAPGRGMFTEEDLPDIEEEMRRIIKADKPLVREVWDREKVRQFFIDNGEAFKAEWVMELPEDEPITMYKTGQGEADWIDLCRGPHLPSTGYLDPKAFKLTRVSGAYWRGDQSNPMLSRIYGTAWLDKKQLKEHLHRLEEAAKRDHRKLGAEMDLFHLQQEAHGSVFWHPQGYKVWRALEAYMRRAIDEGGYDEIKTPQLMDVKQWTQSGHWGKYAENMFAVPDIVPNVESDEEAAAPDIADDADWMAIKPMNCPAHVLVFKQGITSYRELPIRLYENGCCHRNEPHGALHGLMRVRQFTQDDAHIFCTEDQVVDEIHKFCKLADRIYKDFGYTYHVKLATRPEKRFGTEEMWDKAEQEMRDAVKAAGMDNDEYGWEELEGEGAFYAPKLEWHLTDAIGRTWQVGTIQSDRVLPERLDATYIGEDGERHRPVMLHRAIFGSYERFIGMLIEHYAGRMPLWLAPTQAVVATIVSDADDYAGEVLAKLQSAGFRAEADLRNEKINYKVREHSLAKVPLLLVVGKREAEEGTVALRRLGSDEHQKVMKVDALITLMQNEATPPDLRQ
ncbi:MAG: threonine--tRNA ligase [Sphingomonas sp.]|nr:threonine--tRNA ligase [Sphingomonas sp.]RZV52486.1 MAG: threonine--tRNA ligase [Sphingomonadaceae bacterium]